MKAKTKRTIKETLKAYAFLMPNIVGFLLFTSLPVIASFILSFTEWAIIGEPPKFVGLDNFIKILGFHIKESVQTSGSNSNWTSYLCFWKYLEPNDKFFWKYLGNTLFLMLSIPVNIFASLFLALVLNQKIKGIVFFRTVFFLPTLSAGVGLWMLWRWLYNADFGLINSLLSIVGIKGPEWLGNTAWAKPALMLMFFWLSLGGYNMVLFLAGLQGIPRDYYEAAEIDGASWWHKFRHITWPMLSPTTFFIFTMSLIGGFQGGFDVIYMMTGGGPAGATTTINYYIWQVAFNWFKMGYGAALAWVLFLIIFVVTLINWKYTGRRVHYF